MKIKHILLYSVLLGLIFVCYQSLFYKKSGMNFFLGISNEELLEIPKKDRPDLAALHDYKITMDPALGYPPRERLFESKHITSDLIARKKNSRAIDDVQWEERGPNNVAGRTRAIMFDPNDSEHKKVWAGSVGGGLWYNDDITDPNTEWLAKDNFLPNLAISTLAYDPSNASVFYFGTGEGWRNLDALRGAGIWTSTDAGDSWNRLESTESGFEYVQKIVVTNESTVLAAVNSSSGSGNDGILRSEDGGLTWEVVLNSDYGVDLERTGENLYASTMDGKLYKSTDDGENWSNITPETGADRIEIGVAEEFPDYIYVVGNDFLDAEWLYSSQDAGESWTEVSIPKYFNSNCSESNQVFTREQGWYDLIIAVSPDNPNTVVVGGVDLYKSDNGGASWDLISYWTGDCASYVHADQHNFLFRPSNPNEAICSNDGGVYFVANLDDRNPNFEARNNNYNVTQFYGCAMGNEPLSNVFLAGAQDNGSQLYNSYGVNSTFEVTGGDGAFCFIDQNDQDFMITSYVYNNYFVSTDGMSNYTEFGIGDESGQFINPTAYDSRTQSLFGAGNSNQINVYTNLTSFNITERTRSIDLDGAEISFITPSSSNSDNLIVGTYDGQVFNIENIFDTSPSTDLLGDFSGSISSIAIGTSDDQLLVTISNYGVTSVYETRDGGDNWEDKEGDLPDMPIRWGLYNPNNTNEVLLATELGIWSIDDISATELVWEPSNEGLANVSCHMLSYRDADGLVAVATHGRGLFTSDVFVIDAIVDFSTDATVAYVGNPLSFINRSLKSTSYNWNFGDGNTSTFENPIHTYDTKGTYIISLTINGEVDNIITKEITVLPLLSPNFDLAAGGDFESNEDYFISLSASGTAFELGSSNVSGKSGTESGTNAWVTGLNDSEYEPRSESYLYTPAFDFTLSGNYVLSFYTKYEIEDEWDGFVLEYSYDGATWYNLGDNVSDDWYNQNAVNGAVVFDSGEAIFSGDTGGEYVEKTYDLNDLSNNDLVAFRFVFKTDLFEEEAGLTIDDFELSGPIDTTPNLSFLSSVDEVCIGDEVVFTNESSGLVSNYVWEFGEGASPEVGEGFGPFTVTYSSSGDKTITLTAIIDSGEMSESVDLTTSDLPLDRTVTGPEFACTNETVTIEIADSELGVNYMVFNLNTEEIESLEVSGTGSTIGLVIEDGITSSSIFKVIAESENGCLKTLLDIVEVTYIEAEEVSISEDRNAGLSASVSDAEDYIWYLDGLVISGATEFEYTPMASGTYEVQLTYGSCVLLSSAFIILDLDGYNSSLKLFPNPCFDVLNLTGLTLGSEISLLDVTGKLIHTVQLSDTENAIELDVLAYRAGIYLVKIDDGNKVVTERVIKK